MRDHTEKASDARAPEESEHKFDTMSLLQGVEASGLSLEEIMREFSDETVKPAPLTAGGKPHVEKTSVPLPQEEPEVDAAEDKTEKTAKSGAPRYLPRSAPVPAQEPAEAAEQENPAKPEKPRVSRFQFVELDLHKSGEDRNHTREPETQGPPTREQEETGRKTTEPAQKQGEENAQAQKSAGHKPEENRPAERGPKERPALQPAGKQEPSPKTPAPRPEPPRPETRPASQRVASDAQAQLRQWDGLEEEPAETPLPASPMPSDLPPGQPVRNARVIYPDEEPEEELHPAVIPGKRRRKKKFRRPEEPPHPEPSVPGAYRYYRKAARGARARLLPAVILSILAAILTFSAALDWTLLPFLEAAQNRNLTLLALQLVTTFLCYDIVVRGVYDLLRLRFGMEGLATAAGALILLQAAVAYAQETPPFCAAGCFVMAFTLWGSLQKKTGMRRSLKTLMSAETLTDVRRVNGLWEEGSCTIKAAGEPEGFITDMEKPDRVETVMGVYGPALLAAALVLAIVLQVRYEIGFLWGWTALVCAGLPLAGGICFARPWDLIARRLQRQGAALSGWHGAKALSEADGVTVQDEDLFPEGSMILSGMKLFGDFQPNLVVGYAASLVVPLGGSLAPLFQALLEQHGGQWFEPSGLRAFEGGGIGADIRGDVVQVGSMSFMQLMGVRLPRGTNVRQAVYVSINGELAGVFAISYQKARGVQRSLRALARQRELRTVFALRDFLLSPAMLRQIFSLPQDGLEYPRVETRLNLSQPVHGAPGVRGGVLTRGGLPAYAELVCGAARLRAATRRNLALCVLTGVLGCVGLIAALVLGTAEGAIPAALLVYGLLWTAILSLSSAAVLRF